MNKERRFRRAITRWLRANTIAFAAWTAVSYLMLIPISIFVFPDTSLITTVLVVFTGLTSSVASLGSLLVQLEDS